MYRGEIWWAQLPNPVGSEPGYRRPVLINNNLLTGHDITCDRLFGLLITYISPNPEFGKIYSYFP